ncbi:hypothetical protein EMIHUDRAFT_246658 [Emiliania huxleyi CCMP1516]|uniref:Uncharacterized protein n=2 Tax=Emiliania huxleyi TaxID=2903 RepID=A0A0D3IR37_EMIH1|nr:hypothetical protein EMIHUDRAFT_246658 [Emiliania huxleyi CCMP1516]EOD13722.1 hypothetical protein EMIHUDRAFT_246658 [Emiliania huxleyi CCMP1516]|eukprot:XP_005766151.1 hypothetical protein EMIHUDRAFT_246658 [Emiliania huxleyi CCMP1516]
MQADSSRRPPPPRSCDTFVYVAGGGGPAATVFGKNADRPSDEAHEVERTHAVVLSKPAWMWGLDLWLLGMDLLRLALERGATARAAGGACEEGGDWTYENGFLLADARQRALADAGEAFVVETAGTRHWAVERVPPGVESCSAGLKELCGWWDGEGPFDWKRSVGEGDVAGWLGWMAGVLRDEESGICFRSTHGFMSTGSQISLARGGGHTASHFFTAASDPLVACYKRWTFGDPAAAAAGDGGSLALWRRWRSIDLAGRSVPEAMRRALLEIEAEAVSAAERGGASEFSGSVARELELISSFAV